jgi:hypothetical protein
VISAPRQGPDWFALVAVTITVVIHEILTALNHRPNVVFIVSAALFWIGFAVVRARQDPAVLDAWGFRKRNLLPASVAAALLGFVSAAALAGYAWWHETLRFPAHTWVLLLLYPLWGLVQQFVTLGIIVGNLQRLPGWEGRRALVWLAGVLLFGLIHAYDARLAVGTAVLEMAVIPLFWRFGNLWPLGVLHGWMGALFYLWGLNIDMWDLTFGGR